MAATLTTLAAVEMSYTVQAYTNGPILLVEHHEYALTDQVLT